MTYEHGTATGAPIFRLNLTNQFALSMHLRLDLRSNKNGDRLLPVPIFDMPRVPVRYQAQLKPLRCRGRVRMRLPVAAKMALATAGRIGGSVGSPRPVGAKSVVRQ